MVPLVTRDNPVFPSTARNLYLPWGTVLARDPRAIRKPVDASI
jgi:hypothetical protein